MRFRMKGVDSASPDLNKALFGTQPFLSISISLAIGVALEAHFFVPLKILLFPAGLVWLIAATLYLSRFRFRREAAGVLCLIAVMTSGMLIESREKKLLERADSLTPFLEQGQITLEGSLVSMPKRLSDKTILTLQAERVFREGGMIPVQGRVRISASEVPDNIYRGDRVRMRVFLDRPTNFNNPGGFDYVRYLARRGIAVRGTQARGTAILRMGPGAGFGFKARIEMAREKIGRVILENGGEGEGLIRALIIGDREAVPRNIVTAFQETALAHILSISGLHLGMVALAGFVLFRWMLGLSSWVALHFNIYRISALLTMAAVLFYALLAGMRIPTIRALVMAWVFLIAVISGRTYHVWNLFFLAAFIVLLVWPSALFETSFALSFVAVASLIYLMPRLWILVPRTALFLKSSRLDLLAQEKRFSLRKAFLRIYRYLLNIFLASFIAQLGVLPLLAHYFHQVGPLAPLFNLMILPICGLLIIPAGISGAGLGLFAPGLAGTLFSLIGHVAFLVSQLVEWFSTWRLASILVPPLSGPEIIAWYGLGLSVLEWIILKIKGQPSWLIEREIYASVRDYVPVRKKATPEQRIRILKRLFLLIALISALGSAGVSLSRMTAKRLDHRLHFTVIDVAHGQSILIEFPDNQAMLVDGGGFYTDDYDVGKFVVAPFLLSKWRKSLDVVVLTHPHPDHGRGLRYILSHFRVKEFWTIVDKNPLSDELIDLAKERGITVRIIDRTFPELDFSGVKISVLNPGPEAPEPDADLNDRSIVLKVSYGNLGFLLPADICRKAEAEILELYQDSGLLHSDFLVASHHGSISSSSPAFLKATHPAHAIFSARERAWFHIPHSKVIERYEKIGIRIWRTDKHGAVSITTDGRDYQIKSFLACH
jgi:competence protein ComEC